MSDRMSAATSCQDSQQPGKASRQNSRVLGWHGQQQQQQLCCEAWRQLEAGLQQLWVLLSLPAATGQDPWRALAASGGRVTAAAIMGGGYGRHAEQAVCQSCSAWLRLLEQEE